MTTREKIVAALQKAPGGLTSRQLAEAVGEPLSTVTSCASRMHSYGKLARETVREVRKVEYKAVLWQAKQR